MQWQVSLLYLKSQWSLYVCALVNRSTINKHNNRPETIAHEMGVVCKFMEAEDILKHLTQKFQS